MSNEPKYNFSHLWNDLPKEERERLMPYQIQAHLLHLIQAKAVAIKAHKKYLNEMNEWIGNLERALNKYK